MLQKAVNSFYPDLNRDEARKFGLLGITFFIIIGAYWLLRLLKNTIFFKVAFPESLGWAADQGSIFQPKAKMWSFVVLFVLVLIYSRLVDKVKKQQLFYILCTLYSVLFIAIAVVLFLKDQNGAAYVGKTVLAVTGWSSYFIIESFGSLIVALFWSFTNSITDPTSAKRGFPLVVMMAQVGAIIGSAVLFFGDKIGSLWPILVGASLVLLLVIPVVHYFMKTTPKEMLVGYKAAEVKEKKKEGVWKGLFAGLSLLVSRPYLLGVFVISTVYEAVAQIVEYQMQKIAGKTAEWGSELAFGKFQSIYGMSSNSLALLISLLGTAYLLKRWGVRVSIMIYPIAFLLVLVGIYSFDVLASPTKTQLLWTVFSGMIMVKAFGYAVNNPTKEMMYLPTSKDAKFKTKGFIDTVGARGAKAGGSSITNMFSKNLEGLMVYGTIFGIGLIAFWAVAAFFVGRKNVQLVNDGKVVD